ncbi:MAG: flagellar basal body rod protein FlgB [Buchnera aphidicola (Melaphis rhois)]
MLNKLNKEFNFNRYALNLRAYRQELLASNIANSDTPNYKSLDINFSKILQSLLKQNYLNNKNDLTITSNKHISISNDDISDNYHKIIEKNYIFSDNKVNVDAEKINFVNNSLLYQMEIAFINNKFKTFMSVLKG